MVKNSIRKFALAVTFAALAASGVTGLAQSAGSTSSNPPSTTTSSSSPNSVTGTDPEPQGDVVTVLLVLLGLA